MVIFIEYFYHDRFMTKSRDDVILRDRMQFTFDAAGNRTTLYGRIDLSQYVDPIARKGLAIKEVLFQLRDPTNTGLPNTGAFSPVADWQSASGSVGDIGFLKLYATTRAYENASEVGIASPDVLCIYERSSMIGVNGTGDSALVNEDFWYGPKDLHPEGFTVVSDLLIGIAADRWTLQAEDTCEVDIMLIAEPIKVTTERVNEILSQAQDL